MLLLLMLTMRSQRMMSQLKRQHRYDPWRPFCSQHAMGTMALLLRGHASWYKEAKEFCMCP